MAIGKMNNSSNNDEQEVISTQQSNVNNENNNSSNSASNGTLPMKRVSINLDKDSAANNNHNRNNYSARSCSSFGSGSERDCESRGSLGASVHRNLMRMRTNCDPMRYFDVIETLGEGSMGSVSRVRKKSSAVGGSSKRKFVESEHGCCFNLLTSISFIRPRRRMSNYVEIPRQGSLNVMASDLSSARSWRTLSDRVTESELLSFCMGRRQKDDQSQRSNDDDDNNDRAMRKQSSLISVDSNHSKDLKYALKSIHLDRCYNDELVDELRNELEILRSIDHANIVRPIECFEHHERMFILLELCSGGDLFSRDPYEESHAQKIMSSLFSAIAYLHSKNIVHRDLKFENIMFVNKDSDEVKIIDFGLSQKFAVNEELHKRCGTVYTMAPELIKGKYGSKTDIWSLGVIAFMLLSSSLPFYGPDNHVILKKIVKGKFSFQGRRWRGISDDAKSFVSSLLEKDVHKRPTAEQVVQASNWLNNNNNNNNQEHRSSLVDNRNTNITIANNDDKFSPASLTLSTTTTTSITTVGDSIDLDAEDEKMDSVQAAIQSFAEYGKLKKLALMVIAYKSTSEEIGFLRNMFNKFDTLKNGEISLEEFKEALTREYFYTEDEVENIFHGIDIDGTGMVHYSEFLAATLEAHGSIDEQRVAEAFDRIDCDDTGYITVKNLQEFLGDEIPKKYLDEIIDEADIYRDHRISYEEFLALWDNWESDIKMKKTMVDVKSRRKHTTSNDFTDEDEHFAPIRTSSQNSEVSGSYFYNRQKEQSIRTFNVVF